MDSSDALITRFSTSGTYRYYPKQGCNNFIIKYLESSRAQYYFEEWRKSPSIAEYCRYINDWLILNRSQSSEAIEAARQEVQQIYQRYTGNISEYESSLRSLDQIPGFVILHGGEEQVIPEATLGDGTFLHHGSQLITISSEEKEQGVFAAPAPGINEYYRSPTGLYFHQ